MAVEHYALCPCGSGKKVKFCKCADSIGELERVMKMIQGNQVVAALDRLNHVLKEHPDAAWGLAIKGRLLISLNETRALVENAERFIRLQPSNPLALAQQAVGLIFDDKLSQATESLLKALAESSSGVDAFVLEVSSLLALGLSRQGNYLSARLYATLPLTAPQYQDAELASSILAELNQSPNVNLLLKNLPTNIPRPENVVWGERYDEAMSLLLSEQVLAAEAKFEGLDRQYGGQPAILSALVSCSLWRADQPAQSRLLGKLATALCDTPEEAARIKALSLLVNPASSECSLGVYGFSGQPLDIDESIAACTASPRFRAIPSGRLRGMVEQGEVPPKAVFHILGSPTDLGLAPDSAVGPAIGLMMFFGRQTDREPQVRVLDVRERNRAGIETLVQETIRLDGELKLEREVKVPLFAAVLQPRLSIDPHADTKELEHQLPLATSHFLRDLILETPLLGDERKSLREMAEDPATQVLRTAIVRILEGFDGLHDEVSSILGDLQQILHVPPRPVIKVSSSEELEDSSPLDLTAVDVFSLDDESLVFFFQRTQMCGCSHASHLAAERVVDLPPEIAVSDGEKEDLRPLIRLAHTELIRASTSGSELERNSARAQLWCKTQDVDPAPLLLEELYACVPLNLPERMRSVLGQLTSKHRNNAEVMALVQRFLMQIGILNPDGTPRYGTAPSPAASALVGGESDAPSAAPRHILTSPGAPAPSSGKLWLPGMD